MKEGLNTKKMDGIALVDDFGKELGFVREIVRMLSVISTDDEMTERAKMPYWILKEAEYKLNRAGAMHEELWERYKKAKDSGNSKDIKEGVTKKK